MPDYIRWIRSQIGHEPVILNFSGACITNEAGEVLLQKRKPDQEIWGIPGGALEYGESAAEALRRELLEETGLEVSLDYPIGVYTKYFMEYENGDIAQIIAYFFKCAVTGGSLRIDNRETYALEYFGQSNLPPLFNQQHREMLQDYFEGRKWVFR